MGAGETTRAREGEGQRGVDMSLGMWIGWMGIAMVLG